ncbi:conserved virulence factor C family protein [Rummeliibacillus suwonensis]|uniref:conserved virulence factor C family protein n=1 Tax=Rummeliibacillus suwonensis TaxID=1306154 RepID=UPI001AAFB842|nr:conserved virulence factor C family protein [Rummeliibacillus suwonensis]MBO2536490.1 conserved virulence factor C family protein [Rummeliibacillus suwonensis]
MKIVTIEPTPSPNTMKVILDQELPFGTANNYNEKNKQDAPKEIQDILAIEGVKGVYHVADFLAVERIAKYEWENILAAVRNAFGEQNSTSAGEQVNEHYGEVYVHVQMFKGIPLQVKVFDNMSEQRFGLAKRFIDAFNQAMQSDENYILQRKWVDYGVRYGEKDEIGQSVVDELEAAFPERRITELVSASNNQKIAIDNHKRKVSLQDFDVEDWETRFQLLDQMADPEVSDLPLLQKALQDEKMSIRRLATVYLGMIKDKAVVPSLVQALQDKSAAVRRTAGDCMSDLGFVEFEPAMMQALKDRNKLVRWRAAMFLYETGTEACLGALEAASDDAEFEVKLQAKMAIARISHGEEAMGSVWKQMTEARATAKKKRIDF